MSSLSNKNFELKPLVDKLKSAEESYHKDHGAVNYQSPAYRSFFRAISRIQGRSRPQLLNWDLISFAGDHGKLKGVDVPRFKTGEFLLSLMKSDDKPRYGNPIDFNHYGLDFGVDYQFESNLSYWLNHSNKLVNSKIKARTEGFDAYPAMTDDEMSQAFYSGRKLVDRASYKDRDFLAFHSLGEGQLPSVYALAWALSASDAQAWEAYFPDYFTKAISLEIERFIKKHPISHNPFTNLCFFAGYETVAMIGAMIRCGELGMPFMAADPMTVISFQYACKILPGLEKYGFLLSNYSLHLNEGFQTIPEIITYNPSGEEWYALFWKVLYELRMHQA